MTRATRALRGPVAAALALVFAASACVGDPERPIAVPESPLGRPERSEALVIALVGTLSGPEAWRGEDAFEGADLAVHELNQSLEEGELRFELVALDDGGDPAEAAARISQVAELERSVGIIYAGPPSALAGAEGVLAASGIPGVLVYGDLYGARRLSPHVFQASPSYLWGARRLAAYFLRDRGYRRIGLLAARSGQGDVAVEALRRAVEPRRPVVARYRRSRDIASRLPRLRRRGVEALVVQGDASVLSATLEALDDLDALYLTTAEARTSSAPASVRNRRARRGTWRPQIGAFDEAIDPRVAPPPAGTVAADSYARGAHYLPVPNFAEFARSFRGWWDARPLGWEQRAYDAAHAIGWAARRGSPGEDLAPVLERLSGRRFGGGDIVLGPDDHTFVDQTVVGLWTIPAEDADVRPRRPPEGLRWVPLARGFAIDGRRTDLPPEDWEHLFRRPPPPDAPAPPARRMRYAVSSGRADPVH